MRPISPQLTVAARNGVHCGGQAFPDGSYYVQLLSAVARIAEHPSPTVKAALLAPPKSAADIYCAVADIDRGVIEHAGDRVYLDNAQRALGHWRRIARALAIDLSKPFAEPIKSPRCGNAACPTPEKPAPSVCGGCVNAKSASPTRYCGA